MKKMRWLFAAGVLLFTISSCLPPYPTTSELYQDEFVIVNRDTLINFSDYNTYAVPDTVYFVTDDSTLSPIEQDYSDQIISEVVSNMNSRGYTRVDRDENPDVILNLTALTSTTILYYPGSWWGNWDCYYWYYGCGSWYYPSYPTVSSYKTGSLVIEMADLKNTDLGTASPIALVWNSIIYALSQDNPDFNVNLAVQGVGKAFEISPYLSAN